MVTLTERLCAICQSLGRWFDTWVTLALTAGVPLEIVRKVTGHRTAEIVMKHYFQPGRDEFRRTLAGKLPALLGGPAEARPPELDDLRARLKGMKAQTWKKVRDELLARLPSESTNAPSLKAELVTLPVPDGLPHSLTR